jgi:predicted DNA binding CopG/RHH family protein
MWCVATRSTHLSTWVPDELKCRFTALAASRGISDSALLKQLVEFAVASVKPEFALSARYETEVRGARITIRLLASDRLLLRERAAARGMRVASYVSTLTRAHLRSLSPLPDREIEALQGIGVQLAAMGRNIRTIALSTPSTGLTPTYTSNMLMLCEAARDYIKAILSINIRSWQSGHEEGNPGA